MRWQARCASSSAAAPEHSACATHCRKKEDAKSAFDTPRVAEGIDQLIGERTQRWLSLNA